MYTPDEDKLDYTLVANEIAEWFERSYGYFVNKSSDKGKATDDFAKQLSRLPVDAMSYIEQNKNHFIDSGIKLPPSPATFIQELKICFNKNKKVQKVQPVYVDKIKFIAEKIYKINGDENKIKFIKMLHEREKLGLKVKSIASMSIEEVLKRNNFNENEIREIIGS